MDVDVILKVTHISCSLRVFDRKINPDANAVGFEEEDTTHDQASAFSFSILTKKKKPMVNIDFETTLAACEI